MKASTPIGIVVCIVGILAGAAMEGTPLGGLLNVPAILIIFGGIAGVSIATSGMEVMKLMPTLYKKAMTPEFPDHAGTVRQLVGFAEKARKRGPARARGRHRGDRRRVHAQGHAAHRRRHRPRARPRDPRGRDRGDGRPATRVGQKLFKDAGGFAPTIGILGTVMGLVHVLQQPADARDARPRRSPAPSSRRSTASARRTSIFLPTAGRLATSRRPRSSTGRSSSRASWRSRPARTPAS